MTEERTPPLLYVYAVLDEDAAAAAHATGVRGVGGGPVEVLRHAGLAALVGPVPHTEFDEEPLRRNLEDLDWLERTARAHQGVVARAARRADVLPLRMTTVCRGEAGVRRLLAEGRARFAAALEALSGRVEWGVKVFAATPAPGTPRADSPRTGGRSAPAAGAGRAYLRQRSGARREAEAHAARADACAHEVHDALAALAERTRLYRPQHPQLSGTTAENLLNAAYLVPERHSEAFAERVGKLAEREPAVRIELTGPWAPYSFADAVADAGTEGRDDASVRG
ncbi:GvpL/GvpF family gas vesicle protein [Streptomyces sp. ODS28]|uniref:GvpL/GvpF family gas vesicle protein n=1 Tax=Streptomyces sp. ODS28 TaxID=3136688 RepID=UPI0031E50E2A